MHKQRKMIAENRSKSIKKNDSLIVSLYHPEHGKCSHGASELRKNDSIDHLTAIRQAITLKRKRNLPDSIKSQQFIPKTER